MNELNTFLLKNILTSVKKQKRNIFLFSNVTINIIKSRNHFAMLFDDVLYFTHCFTRFTQCNSEVDKLLIILYQGKRRTTYKATSEPKFF